MSEPVEHPDLVAAQVAAGVPLTEEEPLFTWNFDHRMDPQKRVQFPAAWRSAAIGTRFVMVLWPHHQVAPESEFALIKGLPPKRYRQWVAQVSKMGIGNPKVAAFRRRLFHSSIELELDPAGRLCLPPKMATAIGLSKEVHFVGAGDHFELWDHAAFVRCTRADGGVALEAYETLI